MAAEQLNALQRCRAIVWRTAVFAACALAASANDAGKNSEPTILSQEGSGRATAYLEQNKIVTVGHRTHVAWLDGSGTGFRVRMRSLDHDTGAWSPTVLIGEAQDNHGGPALTVDSRGFLHIVYYPHHGAIRYRRSVRPNDSSEWEPEIKFGDGLTYPSMLCGPDDTLILAARRGFHDAQGKSDESKPYELELWTKPLNGPWQRERTLIRSRQPGYAQFAASLAWAPDHRGIHLCCRIYEGSLLQGTYEHFSIAYMFSPDAGRTWQKADGTSIALPGTANTMDILAAEINAEGPKLHAGALAVDAHGVPHLFYSATFHGHSELYLAEPAPGLGWTRRSLNSDLPPGWEKSISYLNMGGGITFSESGRATLVAVVTRLSEADALDPLKAWGNPGSEVVRFWSDDGLKTFQSEVVGPIDPAVPHWLPTLERATGFNRVPEAPGMIYTAGGAGKGLKDLDLNTRVLWRALR